MIKKIDVGKYHDTHSIIKGTKVRNQKCRSNEDLERCIKQPAEIVATNVKYHLSQETINLFTVTIVFKIINQKEVKEDMTEVVEDLVVEEQVVMAGTTEMDHDLVVEEEEMTDLERCIKQPAEIVATNVKYHLSQEMLDQFTVPTVSKIINRIS